MSCLIVVSLWQINNILAQESVLEIPEKKASKLKNKAKQALRLGDTFVALAYYEKLVETKDTDAETLIELANIYQATRDYVKAEKTYLKALKIDKDADPDVFLSLGRMQKSNNKYDEALETLTKLKKKVRKLKDRVLNKEIKVEIQGAEMAILMKDSSEVAFTEHLNNTINKPHIEFSPIPMGEDKFVYGSLREDEVKYYDKDSADVQIPQRKFYLAQKSGDEWTSNSEFDGPFNKTDLDIGNGSLSPDGQRFYFTRCDKSWKNKIVCQIYCSELEGGQWAEPYLLGNNINSGNYTATQPCIGQESRRGRDVLYFVSDRPEGKGGLDIWYAIYDAKKKTFKTPRNAGSRVNTAGTDCTPHYVIDKKTLYFSSDGRSSYGGLDVFKAIGENGKWIEGVNVGKPINSPQDDLDFVLADDESGFFVSNRPGGNALLSETCCDDIYSFKWRESITINLLAKVNNALTNECLRNTDMTAYILVGKDRITALNQNSDDCSYDIKLEPGFDYTFVVEKDGYKPDSVSLSTKNITTTSTLEATLNLTPPKNVKPDPVVEPKPEPITFDGKEISRNENIRLKDIYYEFDRDELTPKAKQSINNTLLIFMNKYPTMTIMISSHTDSKGTDEYNEDLSQRRAQSVVNYLIANNIDPNRLQAKGFGEFQPIAPNKMDDGSDNPEGRALNRRTEFKIIDY